MQVGDVSTTPELTEIARRISRINPAADFMYAGLLMHVRCGKSNERGVIIRQDRPETKVFHLSTSYRGQKGRTITTRVKPVEATALAVAEMLMNQV